MLMDGCQIQPGSMFMEWLDIIHLHLYFQGNLVYIPTFNKSQHVKMKVLYLPQELASMILSAYLKKPEKGQIFKEWIL